MCLLCIALHCHKVMLTLRVPVTQKANIVLTFEFSARKTVYIKCQALFSVINSSVINSL